MCECVYMTYMENINVWCVVTYIWRTYRLAKDFEGILRPWRNCNSDDRYKEVGPNSFPYFSRMTTHNFPTSALIFLFFFFFGGERRCSCWWWSRILISI